MFQFYATFFLLSTLSVNAAQPIDPSSLFYLVATTQLPQADNASSLENAMPVSTSNFGRTSPGYYSGYDWFALTAGIFEEFDYSTNTVKSRFTILPDGSLFSPFCHLVGPGRPENRILKCNQTDGMFPGEFVVFEPKQEADVALKKRSLLDGYLLTFNGQATGFSVYHSGRGNGFGYFRYKGARSGDRNRHKKMYIHATMEPSCYSDSRSPQC